MYLVLHIDVQFSLKSNAQMWYKLYNVNAYILINNEIKTLYKSSLHLQVQNKNGLIVRSFLTPWHLICIFIACIKYELREFAFFMGVTIVLWSGVFKRW